MLPNPKRPRKRQATSKRSARSESSAAPHQAPLPSSSSGPFNDDINPVPIYQDFSAFDLGGLDDWSYQNQDQDIVGGEEPGDGTAGLNEAQVYAEMLFSQQSAYVARIDHRTWVLEGNANGICQEGQFYHVTLYEGTNMTGADEQLASCDCPAGRNGVHCPHKGVLLEHCLLFKKEIVLSQKINPIAIQIAAHLRGRRAWFSVLSTRSTIATSSQDGKRCIVSMSDAQLWTCSASHCSSGGQGFKACLHRQRAHQVWSDTGGDGAGDAGGHEDINDEDDVEEAVANDDEIALESAYRQVQACSHLSIPPPPFVRLPFESVGVPVTGGPQLPATLPLGSHARCDCGQRSSFAAPVRLRNCTIYYSNGPVSRLIQTQECDCRSRQERRSIGPDLSEYGLFNWNNSIVVAHEVFNAYTSQLSASPTLFTAFCLTIQHAYEQHAPGTRLKFLHRSTFVKLYFAYISLQQLDVDFSCQLCGPTPSIVIADGVVLAYNASFRLAELSPPTTTGSDINDSVRSGSITPFLPIPAARAALKQLAEVLVSDPDQCLQPLQQLKIAVDDAKAMAPILRLWVGRLQQLLVDICLAASLGSLSPSLKSALQQLVAQFAANEGVLQLCRPLCCPILVNLSTIKLEEAPKELLVRLSTTLSRHCLFLGNVFVCLAHDDLNAAEKSMRTSLQALMASTAQVVDHQMTLLNARTPPSSASASPPISYTKSGTLYGASQCRTRPTYPHLNEGQDMRNSEKQARLEGADKGHQCRKFYDEYVKRQRTGGIMALWCTHCICVGFHVIPHAEGRNDVFSAIFSYWPRPPSVIVYDFACQLGPYSLRREAGFFKDTLFVVDQMHEKGHSDCSAASRLSTYMRNDPALQHLYSSAAECGNSGLSRIKKTVSFCNQEHAVALVRVFLCVWNRRKKLRMG